MMNYSKWHYCTGDVVPPDEWVVFTRRTDYPKVGWLATQLAKKGIPFRFHGWSSHAPILEVAGSKDVEAWKILGSIDDIPDDAPMFISSVCPVCNGPTWDEDDLCVVCQEETVKDIQEDYKYWTDL